jgi:thiol-disulfide isomerase/thioredoxin
MRNKTVIKTYRTLFILFAISICLSGGGLFANENGITEEELSKFYVTLYSEKEQIPLERLFTVEGKSYDSVVLQGNYVMVNFWGTWCPYCRLESPSIDRLSKEQATGWFSILTISVGEKTENVIDYMRENDYDFPIVYDPENELKDIYAPRIPTTYILDPEGNIIARINGNKEWDNEQSLRILRYLIPKEQIQ